MFELGEIQIFGVLSDEEVHNMENCAISGMLPYYDYTGETIPLQYRVTDYYNDQLVEYTHYTKNIVRKYGNQTWNNVTEIKEPGEYTITINGMNGYTGSKSYSFVVMDSSLPKPMAWTNNNETAYYYVNIPIAYQTTLDLTETDPDFTNQFYVFSNNGYNQPYSPNCNGQLLIHAPEGYVLQVQGELSCKGYPYEYLVMYDGNDYMIPYDGEFMTTKIDGSNYGKLMGEDIGTLVTINNQMLIVFNSNSAVNYEGLDLTATIVDPITRTVEGYANVHAGQDRWTFIAGPLKNGKSPTYVDNLFPEGEVGEPLMTAAYVNKPYYQMSEFGNSIEAVDDYSRWPIPVCTGVMVCADGENETVTFSTTKPSAVEGNGSVKMTLSKTGTRGAEYQDNAIVSFNEGAKLGKYIFNKDNASLCIKQDGNDYAIAYAKREGEVPVEFKTKETGKYTISFGGDDLNGVQFVDKFENITVDLRVSKNYTFIGSAADLTDRFKLVFNAEPIVDGNFAYQNGDDIVVTGDGTLQVYDILGRHITDYEINGTQVIERLLQGVYIFRLVGDEVKTQKVIVR